MPIFSFQDRGGVEWLYFLKDLCLEAGEERLDLEVGTESVYAIGELLKLLDISFYSG